MVCFGLLCFILHRTPEPYHVWRRRRFWKRQCSSCAGWRSKVRSIFPEPFFPQGHVKDAERQHSGRCLLSAREAPVPNFPLLSSPGAVAASIPQDSQDFVSGYCHCVNTICSFLNSAGSSSAQEMKSQILQHLGRISGPGSTITSALKAWQPGKADTLPSHQPSFLWASPLMPPLDSDSHTLTVGSWLQYSASTPLPQLQKPWIQPALLATTTHVWRPWWMTFQKSDL